MDEENKPQISNLNVIGLVATSLLFDLVGLIGLIPYIGWIFNVLVAIFATLTFYVWFKILGVNYIGTRRILAFASGFILGVFPITSLIAWTVSVVLVIIDVRNEHILEKLKKPRPLTKNLKGRQQLQEKGQRVGERFRRRYEEESVKRIPISKIPPK